MKILAVDDERMALEILVDAIKSADKNNEVFAFRSAFQAIDFMNNNEGVNVAFLDINMREMTGISLAEILKKKNPKINIIFSTGYDEYMDDAFKMHSSGYITKPITKEKVLNELNDLRYEIKETEAIVNSKAKIKVHCFGNFDCFDMNNNPIHFERQKSKEVLAYLIYRKGATCTIKEISAVVFEDEEYDKKIQLYIQKIISCLMKSLREINAEDVVIKNYNALSVNKELLDCDYYKVLENKIKGDYLGEFMAQYSWAEDVNWYLMNK